MTLFALRTSDHSDRTVQAAGRGFLLMPSAYLMAARRLDGRGTVAVTELSPAGASRHLLGLRDAGLVSAAMATRSATAGPRARLVPGLGMVGTARQAAWPGQATPDDGERPATLDGGG